MRKLRKLQSDLKKILRAFVVWLLLELIFILIEVIAFSESGQTEADSAAHTIFALAALIIPLVAALVSLKVHRVAISRHKKGEAKIRPSVQPKTEHCALKHQEAEESAISAELHNFDGFLPTEENSRDTESEAFDISAYSRRNNQCIHDFCENFDLESIPGIQAITPDSARIWETRAAGVPSLPEQILFKKATEYKKAGRMELAIECLRKANELLSSNNIEGQERDYLRVVEYLKLSGRFDEARAEEAALRKMHPEVFGIVKNPKIEQELERAAIVGCDFLQINTSSICPKCSPYSRRIYSISGKDHRFPPLPSIPKFLTMNKCDLCKCCIDISVAFLYLRSDKEIAELSKHSKSPAVDLRTEEQKLYFEKEQTAKARKRQTKIEYDLLMEYLPEFCPKSLSAYSRMKNKNSRRFEVIRSVAEELDIEIRQV